MADTRGTGCGSGSTDTCLIGEQASLDAEHHNGSHEAAEDSLNIKSPFKNACEHTRNHVSVENNHQQGSCNVKSAHYRNKNSCDFSDLFAAAADADAEDNSLDDTDENRSQAWIVETVYFKRICHIEGCNEVKSNHVSQNHENSIENTQPSFFQNGFNIVGRTAVATSVLGTAFVDLCQRTFYKCGCTSEDRGHPHPKDSARTAETDGGRNAGDISGADARSSGNHQCLKGGNRLIFLVGWLQDNPDRFK